LGAFWFISPYLGSLFFPDVSKKVYGIYFGCFKEGYKKCKEKISQYFDFKGWDNIIIKN
jgi:hypothetical protein